MQGSRHGVFCCDPPSQEGPPSEGPSEDPAEAVARPVRDFLQKAPVETLRERALLRRRSPRAPHTEAECEEYCAVDTGVFTMNGAFVTALLCWATDEGEIAADEAAIASGSAAASDAASAAASDAATIAREAAMRAPATAPPPSVFGALTTSRLSFDFYLEVVCACLDDGADATHYARRMRAAGSTLPSWALGALRGALAPMRLRAAILPAHFLHFGSLREFVAASARVRQIEVKPFYAANVEGNDHTVGARDGARDGAHDGAQDGARDGAGDGASDDVDRPPPSLQLNCRQCECGERQFLLEMCEDVSVQGVGPI